MSIIYESSAQVLTPGSAAACSLLRGRGMANYLQHDVDRSEKILLSVDMTDDDVMMRH